MKTLRSLIALLSAILSCLGAMAQEENNWQPYILRHYDNGNGLPQNSVNAIARDQDGYIWLTTENGLVRYDGQSFKLAGISHLALKSNRFYKIFLDETGHIVAWNGKDEMVRAEVGKTDRYHITIEGARGYMVRLSCADRKPVDTTLLRGLPSRAEYWRLCLGEMLWKTDSSSYYYYKSDTVRYVSRGATVYSLPFKTNGSFDFVLLRNRLFFLGKDGTFASFNGGLHQSKLKGDIEKELPGSGNTLGVFWNTYDTSHFLISLKNCFYLVKETTDGDLVTTRLFDGFDIEGKDIVSAYYDEVEQQLYLGSSIHGLFILSHRRFVSRFSEGRFNSFYAQVPYKRDAVLAGSGDILGANRKTINNKSLAVLAKGDFYSMATDGRGTAWLKTENKVFRIHMDDCRLEKTYIAPGPVKILYYTDSTLWIGMRAGNGVARLNTADKNAAPIPFAKLRFDVTFMAKASERLMYLGAEGGLFSLDLQTGAINEVKGMEGRYVRSLTVMGPDEIWATTYDHGFYLYKGGRLTHFPYDRDEYIATAHCMIADKNNFFWISTNKGLFQVSRKDLLAYADNNRLSLYYHYYDRQDGFTTNEFNGGCEPCAVRLGNGDVSIPSLNGMVFFAPEAVKPVLPAGRLFIDQVLLDNRPLLTGSLLKLPRIFSSLQLTYSSPFMGNGKNLQCVYALMHSGGDTSWLPLPANGVLSLSALPAGSYSLVVRKMNGFGPDNFAQHVLVLQVPSAWFETGWFYAGCLSIFIICLLFIVRLRERYLQRKSRQLQAMVDVKTRELQAKSELQERIVQALSHNVLTPLQYQQLLSGKLLEEVRTGDAGTARKARVIKEHTTYLYHMVSNLLKYLKSQMTPGNTDLTYAPAPVAEDVKKIFSDIASERGTAIINNIPADLVIKGDAQLLSVILYNLADNAVKVTAGGIITIGVIPRESSLVFEVRDTGPGLPAAVSEWFNQPGSAPMQKKGGIGLLIVKELAATQGLLLHVQSEAGKGSVFTIYPFYDRRGH